MVDVKGKKILLSLFFFFLAGLFEIGGGYLVWLWLREDMSWVLGAIGGFILFLYGVVPIFQPTYFHRIYATYGGIFIVMALLWGLIFEGVVPDIFDIVGAIVAVLGIIIIFYARSYLEDAALTNPHCIINLRSSIIAPYSTWSVTDCFSTSVVSCKCGY